MMKHEAEEMLAILSAEFGVNPPRLLWRRNTRGGWYRATPPRISMGPLSGGESTVVHEFAHHLDRTHNKRRKQGQFRQGRHDAPFRYALVRVAKAWYGDAAKYPWMYEYRAVKQWWKEKQAAKESQ